jgi:hypothetical protein
MFRLSMNKGDEMSYENLKEVIGKIARKSVGFKSAQELVTEAAGTDTIEFTVKVKFKGKLTAEQVKAIKRDLPTQLESGEAGFGSGTGAFDGIDEMEGAPRVSSATARMK